MEFDEVKTRPLMGEILKEFESATAKFGQFNSTHEGYAVVLEELDEAWDAIKANRVHDARKEMIQVAAMALRWVYDCQPIL